MYTKSNKKCRELVCFVNKIKVLNFYNDFKNTVKVYKNILIHNK